MPTYNKISEASPYITGTIYDGYVPTQNFMQSYNTQLQPRTEINEPLREVVESNTTNNTIELVDNISSPNPLKRQLLIGLVFVLLFGVCFMFSKGGYFLLKDYYPSAKWYTYCIAAFGIAIVLTFVMWTGDVLFPTLN